MVVVVVGGLRASAPSFLKLPCWGPDYLLAAIAGEGLFVRRNLYWEHTDWIVLKGWIAREYVAIVSSSSSLL